MKAILLSILIVYSLGFATEFRDDQFQINTSYDETVWLVQPGESFKDRLTLKHFNLPATINIVAYEFSETITANTLVQGRIQSIYDGWQLLSEQRLNTFELRQKNISEGIRSIYKKTFLDENLNEQQLFTGDICLVSGEKLAIILNVTAQDSTTLLRIKEDFNNVYNSFWVGDKKPLVNFIEPKQDQWIISGQNFSRRRFYQSEFQLEQPLDRTNRIILGSRGNFTNAEFFSNDNGQYILDGSTVYKLDPYNNEALTVDLNLNQPTIQLYTNGFYAIQFWPSLRIKQIDNNLIETTLIDESDRALAAFAINGYFLVINSEQVRLVSSDETIWQIDYKFNDIAYVANLEELIIVDKGTNTLLVFDINKGELKSSISLTELSPDLTGKLVDLAINQGKLLVSMKHNNKIIHSVINIQKALLEDQLILPDIKDYKLVGISERLVIVQYETRQKESFLEAFDFNTFASVWKQPFNGYKSPLISKHNILFLNDNNQVAVGLDLATSTSTTTKNALSLFEPDLLPSDNVNEVEPNILKLIPLKSSLMAVFEIDNEKEIIYLGNKKR